MEVREAADDGDDDGVDGEGAAGEEEAGFDGAVFVFEIGGNVEVVESLKSGATRDEHSEVFGWEEVVGYLGLEGLWLERVHCSRWSFSGIYIRPSGCRCFPLLQWCDCVAIIIFPDREPARDMVFYIREIRPIH